MIHRFNYRSSSGRPEELISDFDEPTSQALSCLVLSELGFGGVVSKLTETVVEVKTIVLHTLDRTVFQGTVEEMKSLVAFACLYVQMTNKHRDTLISTAANSLCNLTGGNALLVTATAGMVLGSTSIRTLLCSLVSETEEDVKTLAGKMHSLDSKDLLAAAQMVLQGDTSKREALNLLLQ